jgi:hypothetical protein
MCTAANTCSSKKTYPRDIFVCFFSFATNHKQKTTLMQTCTLCQRPLIGSAVRGNHSRLPFCNHAAQQQQQQRIGPLHDAQGVAVSSSSSDAAPATSGSDPVPVRNGDGVYIANSTITWPGGRSIGLGLFAGRNFSAGDYITWYYGRREPDVRAADAPPDASEHKFSLGYGYTSDGQRVPYVIDGTYMQDGTPITNPAVQLAVIQEGGGAWANDVSFRASPGAMASVVPPGAINNARFVLLPSLDGNARNAAIYLQALVDVPRNTEVFVDYGPSFKHAPAPDYSSSSRRSKGKRTAPPRKLLTFQDADMP